MTEKSRKKVVFETLKVDAELNQEIRVEAANRNMFTYEVAAEAWSLYKSSRGRHHQSVAPKKSETELKTFTKKNFTPGNNPVYDGEVSARLHTIKLLAAEAIQIIQGDKIVETNPAHRPDADRSERANETEQSGEQSSEDALAEIESMHREAAAMPLPSRTNARRRKAAK